MTDDTKLPPLPKPKAAGLGREYESFDKDGRSMGTAYENIDYFTADQMSDYAQAALASAAPAAGWGPGRPITEEMHVAACKVLARANGLDGTPQRMMDAMLAAAPTAPAAEVLEDALCIAAVSCPHSIDHNRVVLHFDPKQPGNNALNQLSRRLGAATAPAAPVEPSMLEAMAVEELCQLGYTVADGRIVPPEHLHKLAEAAGHPLAARAAGPVADELTQVKADRDYVTHIVMVRNEKLRQVGLQLRGIADSIFENDSPAAPEAPNGEPVAWAVFHPNGDLFSLEETEAAARGLAGDTETVRALYAAPEAPSDAQDAARDVLAERRRQVEAEGWTPEHDDEHGHGEMALAASCYAEEGPSPYGNTYPTIPTRWPWDPDWWKPAGYRRNLVKAGALILAEIERLDRAAIAASEAGKGAGR